MYDQFIWKQICLLDPILPDRAAHEECCREEDRVQVDQPSLELSTTTGERTQAEGQPVIHLGSLQDAAPVQATRLNLPRDAPALRH